MYKLSPGTSYPSINLFMYKCFLEPISFSISKCATCTECLLLVNMGVEVGMTAFAALLITTILPLGIVLIAVLSSHQKLGSFSIVWLEQALLSPTTLAGFDKLPKPESPSTFSKMLCTPILDHVAVLPRAENNT